MILMSVCVFIYSVRTVSLCAITPAAVFPPSQTHPWCQNSLWRHWGSHGLSDQMMMHLSCRWRMKQRSVQNKFLLFYLLLFILVDGSRFSALLSSPFLSLPKSSSQVRSETYPINTRLVLIDSLQILLIGLDIRSLSWRIYSNPYKVQSQEFPSTVFI